LIDAQQMFLLFGFTWDSPTWCRTFLNTLGDVMKQLVFLGMSKSGRLGYFSNGILAWGLTPEQYEMPTEWHKAHATKINPNFEFVEGEDW
jgi:hypothetical protein